MKPVEYHMSAADLRTFDRWHARGAAILVAALVVMPWLVGIGPNAARGPAPGPDAAGTTGMASPATAPSTSGTAPSPATPAAGPAPGGDAPGATPSARSAASGG